MEIKRETLIFNQTLIKRRLTDYIILHHRAGDGNLISIHKEHIRLEWAGIGYHFYVRKNGEVFAGRPINTIGSQCKGMNDKSIGICFEGNFETEKMNNIQFTAGIWLLKYLRTNYYPKAKTKIAGHKEFYATACPGKNFPLDKFKAF